MEQRSGSQRGGHREAEREGETYERSSAYSRNHVEGGTLTGTMQKRVGSTH